MPAIGSVTSRLDYQGLNRSLSQRLLTQGVSVLLGLGTLFCGTPASFADIIPDGSTPSIINLGINTDCSLLCGINGGYQQGDNLFHSFSEFIIPPGGSALLSTPTPVVPSDVERIFIRVVGATTEIDGSFAVGNIFFRNSPDVIFLSPQGIRIGQDARLSYSGNFLFSTAERLDFGSGAIFDATNSDPLLTLSNFGNLPGTLQLDNSTGIINFSNNNTTGRETIGIPQTQHQFAVIGGAINFDRVEIATPGKLNIASVGNNQTVGLTFQSDGIDFDYETASIFQDIELTDSTLSIRSLSSLDDANSLELVGQNLRLRESSLLSTLTNAEGGDINLDFTGLVEFETASEIASRANTASAIAGDISINSNEVRLAQGSQIVSFTTTDGGDITFDVAGSVILDSQSKIFTRTTIPTGNAGNITLSAASLALLAQNQISTRTNSGGGEVNLIVTGDIQVDNSSLIVTSSQNNAAIAGDITLTSDSLSVTNSGKIISGFNGFTSGNIEIDLNGNLDISSNGEIATSANFLSSPVMGASAGNILISGTNLSLEGAGKLYTLTENLGGDLNLDFSEDIFVHDSDSFIAVFAAGTANAGTLDLQARNLNLSNRGEILSRTSQGGGDLNFALGQDVSLNTGSSIASQVNEGSGGSAGDLNLSGSNLTIDGDNSILFSLTENGGGNINLNLADDVTLTTGAQLGTFITSNGDAINGDAGSLSLQARNLSLNNNADIITETSDGHGDIDIDLTGDLSVVGGGLGNSEIITKLFSTKGAAGNISISANNVNFDQGFLLTETDQPGGNINVDTITTIQFDQSLIRLSSPTGTGHTGNLELTSQSNGTSIGISLTDTEIFNEANNTGGNVTLTTPGEVELRDGSFISIDASGAEGNLTVSASAFRSNAIGADNDVLLNQGTLNNLFLPAEVTGFDPLADQVVRTNANSELLPNPVPPPVVPPPVVPPPVAPPVIPPTVVTPASPPALPESPNSLPSVMPPVDNNPIVKPLDTPTSRPTPPKTNDNTPPPYSEFRYLSSQTENFLTTQELLAFYGESQSSSSSGFQPKSCFASGLSLFKISGRGGTGSSPSSLDGSSPSLTDLGQFDEDTLSDSSTDFSQPILKSSEPDSHWREAQTWQQNLHGKIKLVAHSNGLWSHPQSHRCQFLR